MLIASLEDLKGADVSDDLRVIAFSKVFDLHAQATGLHAPRNTDTGVGGRDGRGGAAEIPDVAGDKLEAIAVKASASRETVAEVYEVRDDGLDLIIPQGKLPAPTASATKEIALLLAGGRQAAGIDEVDISRRGARHLQRLQAHGLRQLREDHPADGRRVQRAQGGRSGRPRSACPARGGKHSARSSAGSAARRSGVVP